MPLVLADPTCAAEVAKIQDHKLFFFEDKAHPREHRVVVANGVFLREGPSTDAAVYQKLGYGVQVAVVASGCAEGWTLVVSPYGSVAHGVGFIKDELLGTALLGEAAVTAKRAAASSPEDAASWALVEAVYFPSEAHRTQAKQLAAAATPKPDTVPLPCDTFFGACALLARTNDHGGVPVPDALAHIPVGPWWTLPSARGVAEPALFRAAYIDTTGECDSCGTVACASRLQVALDPIGKATTGALAASRRPPPSWFTAVSDGPCARAEAAARASARWDVPVSDDPEYPFSDDPGYCIPGEDGSAWWVKSYGLSNSDGPQWRSYRVWPTRGVTARADRPPLALRDLNGDGDVETLWGCPNGWVCTDDPGIVLGWGRLAP